MTTSGSVKKWVEPGQAKWVTVPVPWEMSRQEALAYATRMVEAHGCRVEKQGACEPWPQFNRSFRPTMGLWSYVEEPKIENCPTPFRWNVFLFVERMAA